MQPDVRLAVIIVTYNSQHHMAALAKSLRRELKGISNHEVVVVDNASTDSTVFTVRDSLPESTLIEAKTNRGYAAAINTALRELSGEAAVLILNPDVELQEGCVAKLLAAIEDSSVGIAVPRLLFAGVTSHSLRREPSLARVWGEALLGGRRAGRFGLSEVITDPQEYRRNHDVDWATGAVMMLSASCRKAVGMWDESFFLYSEEVDFCHRARAAGLKIRFVADAVAEHLGGEYAQNPDLWRILVRNRIRYFQRSHGVISSSLFRAGVLANELIRAPSSRGHRSGVVAALRATRRADRLGLQSINGFLWFAAQDWWYHNQAHSDFQLMRELARTRPVLVVNSLGLRVPRRGVSTHPLRRIGRKLKSTAKFVRTPLPDNPGFHVMTPLLLPFYGDGIAARFNAWFVRWQVRTVATILGIGARPTIGVTIPTAWPVVRRMKRSSLIFNRSDLHSAFPEADGGWVASLELALMQNSDRVVYVSRELLRQDRDIVGDRAHFLDHGVDIDHFTPGSSGDIAREILEIPGPRVGFFGGLDDYVVDMDLLKETALRLPDTQLVLIGDATCSMDQLLALPNVHWLGYRPYESIPALGRGFDVAIMPWLDNEWIRYANPIKLKEYLALGLPVVTTEYPAVDGYRDRVLVASSRADFPELVRAALADPGDPAARRASVLEDSWRARAESLADIAEASRSN